MAGPNDSPSPENLLAKGLASGDATPKPATPADASAALHDGAYTPPPGAPNASRPGAPTPVADAQAGGPGAPPADTPVAAAPAADATPAAKPPGADAAPAAPVTVADGGDRTKTADAPAAQSNALDVMHKVNSILDNDVPTANKAHDLDAAKKAYEQAIALAETLTPQDIAKAQQDLAQVRKDKAAATDPATQRDLANKEVDLYTITRLKDAALGNMALWYYRQGKTEDGNAKLLEACGVDPVTAQKLKKMGPDETKAFGAILTNAPELSPILGDVNFYNQIGKINKAGGQVPDVFSKIHDAVLQHNKEVASAPGGSDKPAGAPGDAGAGQPVHYDAAKNNADMQAFIDLNNQLKDKPGPITDAQRQVLKAGVAAYDAQNTFVGQYMDNKQAALDKVLPKDKQVAFAQASVAVNNELQKVADANQVTQADGTKVGQIPAALQTKIGAVLGAKTPADFQAASAELSKTNPDLTKALQAAAAVLPPGDAGMQAMKAFQEYSDAHDAFSKSSTQQILAHYSYAKILSQTKNPPDPTDMAEAKQVFKSGFKNTDSDIANNALNSKEFQTLGTALGLADKPGTAPGADKAGATPGATGDQTAAQGLAALSPQDLQTKLDAAKKQGAAGMSDAKALYEEEIRRAEDPARTKIFNDQLKANVTALEAGKDASGKALDPTARMALHLQDVQLISALSTAAQLHSEYALYLGDNRLSLDATYPAQMSGGLNQIKSMDAEQRKAIAAADAVDPDLLKRADAQINADRKAGTGDSGALDQFKIAMEGGKDAQGQDQLGMMTMRVTLRDQLAALYLMQGKQFNADGSVMSSIAPTSHHTDELFKPQDALQLLKDARAANETINGKGAHDTTTDQLFAMGQTMQPDVFKNNSDALKKSGASALSDMAAMGGSIAGSTVVKWGAVALAETLSKGEINPAILNTIGNASAIGTGILTRHLAERALTGQWENWSDSIMHGTAAALVPIGFKYSSEFLASNKLASATLNVRSAAITGESLVQRAAGTIGPEATFGQVAEQFKASGLTREAGELEALGAKPVASATADELAALNKSLNLNGARGREAMLKLFPTMDRAAGNANIANALEANGIKTVGQLQGQLDANAARVTGLGNQIDSSVKDGTSVSDALKQMKVGVGADAKPAFATREALDQETKFLSDNNIKTVGQLRAATKNASAFFQVGKLYPEFAGATADTPIRQLVTDGAGFGDAASAGRVQLKNILPDAQLGPAARTPGIFGKIGGAADGLVTKTKDAAYFNRMWAVSMDRPVVTFPNMAGKASSELVAADAGAAQTGVKGFVSKFKPEFNAPSMPNVEKINPLYSTQQQVSIASSQTKFWSAALSTGVGMGAYNVTTGLYDNWWKGAQYRDSKGEYHPYTFMGALGQAGEATLPEMLMGGFLLKGAIAPVLEQSSAASAPGWLASKIPALRGPVIGAANEAVAGSGAQLKNFATFGAFGVPSTWQGGLDLINSGDKKATYDSTQKPLKDYAPDNVGTTGDSVADQPPAADGTVPAPADSTPAAVNPNADVPSAPAAPPAKASDATTPAPAPAKANDATTPAAPAAQPPAAKPDPNQVGGALAPPGS